ncbi:MAG: SEL1-like repeat protein [Rickettsiales bacterium]|nr:SEL1-like repeat protein [Rickettsiales bacterium]
MNKIFQIIIFSCFFIAENSFAQLRIPKSEKQLADPQMAENSEVQEFNKNLMIDEYSDFKPISKTSFEDKKTEAIQNDDALNMFIIGQMYLGGINTEQDYKQAKEWFKLSADLGNSDAMLQLSRLMILDKNISGLEMEPDSAKIYLEKAVRARNSKAYMEIGRLYEIGYLYNHNPQKAIKFYQLAAQAGNVNAYAKLASIFLFGRGVEKDLKVAVNYLRLLKKTSKDENIIKQANDYLANIYFDIALTLPNGNTKFQFFMLAWDHGNKKAGDAIGEMYYKGAGIGKDYLRAKEWFEKSAALESAFAYEKLGMMYVEAPGDIERDYTKAMDNFQKAARLGSSRGAYMIGYLYENGLGVPKDENQATMWRTRSETLRKRAGDSYNRKIEDTTAKF